MFTGGFRFGNGFVTDLARFKANVGVLLEIGRNLVKVSFCHNGHEIEVLGDVLYDSVSGIL
jgi:hypothetical protein